MTYRNDVDALAARHAALATQATEIAKQRDEAGQMLEEARAKARLPVLDNLRVASPCSQAWAEMSGDERVRACAKCQKDVYNLSGMTRDEAETLIRAKNGDLCVRYFQRTDGTILLADCTVGRRTKRMVRIAAAAAVASFAGAAASYALRASPERKHEVVGEARPTVEEIAGGASFAEPAPPARVEPEVHEVHELKGKMVIAPEAVKKPAKPAKPARR